MFKVQDQVVVKIKTNRTGPLTKEVRVGQITAFADEKTAVVSLPERDGRMVKKEIPLSQLQPVSNVYRRSAVQFDPTRRQIHVGF
jgi:hypothetical protein